MDEKHCFMFLKDDYPELCEECKLVEISLIENDSETAIIKSGQILENLTKTIWENEDTLDMNVYHDLKNQGKRIGELKDKKILSNKEYQLFNYIRDNRNHTVHTSSNITNYYGVAVKCHQKLYEIVVMFYKKYKDSNFEAPQYSGPIYKHSYNSKQIEEKLVELKHSVDSLKESSEGNGDTYIINSYNTTNHSFDIDTQETNNNQKLFNNQNNLNINHKEIKNTNVGIETNNTVNDTRLNLNQTNNDLDINQTTNNLDIKNTKNNLNLEDNRKIIKNKPISKDKNSNFNSKSKNYNHKKLDSKGFIDIRYVALIVVILALIVAGAYVLGALDSNYDNIDSVTSSNGGSSDLSNPFWASTNSGKFHKSSCEWAQKISDDNLVTYPTRDEAIASGMVPCQVCNP